MSANNYLLIREVELPDKSIKYIVLDTDAESNSGGFFIKDEPFNSLREAIKAAQDYMSENIVEYGISFDLEEK